MLRDAIDAARQIVAAALLLAVVVGVLAVIVTAAHAEGCIPDNNGHMICGAVPPGDRTTARRAHSVPRGRAAAHSRRHHRPPPVIDTNGNRADRIIAHPAGCPWRAFCGCGASVEVFGHPVRSLYLAANWRRFPSAAPAPGMAAWRYGHVFIIKSVNGDGTVVAIDHNSGGHLSRIRTVSLRGYRIVNPHASRFARAL